MPSASAATASSTATTSSASTATTTSAGAASSAVGLEVRVADDESASHQPFHVVDSGAVEKGSAVSIDEHLYAYTDFGS